VNGVGLFHGFVNGVGLFLCSLASTWWWVLFSWCHCCSFAGGVLLAPAMAPVVKGDVEMGWWLDVMRWCCGGIPIWRCQWCAIDVVAYL
jgi:hypothetical protein